MKWQYGLWISVTSTLLSRLRSDGPQTITNDSIRFHVVDSF